jgi:hypothetical protein
MQFWLLPMLVACKWVAKTLFMMMPPLRQSLPPPQLFVRRDLSILLQHHLLLPLLPLLMLRPSFLSFVSLSLKHCLLGAKAEA